MMMMTDADDDAKMVITTASSPPPHSKPPLLFCHRASFRPRSDEDEVVDDDDGAHSSHLFYSLLSSSSSKKKKKTSTRVPRTNPTSNATTSSSYNSLLYDQIRVRLKKTRVDESSLTRCVERRVCYSLLLLRITTLFFFSSSLTHHIKGQKNHTCVCMRARSSSRIKKREKYHAVDDERRALRVHRTRKKMHQNRSRKERETFLL